MSRFLGRTRCMRADTPPPIRPRLWWWCPPLVCLALNAQAGAEMKSTRRNLEQIGGTVIGRQCPVALPPPLFIARTASLPPDPPE